MSKDRELKIIIKADGSVAVNEIKVVAQSTDELEKQLKEARLEMARLEGEFDKVVGKTKSADTEINKLKTDSAALKNENKQLASELQRVQSALTEATTRVRGLEGQLTSATKDVKSFETSWSDLATGVNQALDILGKIKNYGEKAWDFAEQGAQLRAARDSFDDYARSVGKNADEIIAKLKKASGGTINESSLIQTASKAMSLGVTMDADKMANMLEIARNKARLFGSTTQQAFEDLVTGIGRASPQILDNLGIRIPAAFEEMTSGMSGAEKVAKLFELTLEEGNKQLRDMGGLASTNADQMSDLSASWSNLKGSGGELVSKVFSPVVAVLDAIIDKADLAAKKINKLIDTASNTLRGNEENDYRSYTNAQLVTEKALLENEIRSYYFANRAEDGSGIGGPIPEEKRLAEIRNEVERRKNELVSTINNAKTEVSSAFSNFFNDYIPKFSGEKSDWAKAEEAKLKRHQAELKKTTEYYYSLADAMEYTYQANRNLPATLKGTQAGLESAGDAAISFLDNLKLGNADWFRESLLEIAENAAEVANSFEKIKKSSDFFSKENLKTAQTAVQYLQSGIREYLQLTVPTQTVSTWDRYGGNVLSAIWQAGSSDSKKAVKDIQEPLSKTIAEAVSAGFANADFSNLELTLGNVLSSVLTKVVAQKNPVIDSAGAINWGNLGVNLAASYGAKLISGLFTTKEKNKEAIQQASNLEATISSAYLKTFESELLPYIAGESTAMGGYLKDQLYKARMGINGISVGYTYDKDWSWGDLSWQKEYQLNAPGASNALENLNYWNKAAEKYNEQQKRNLELMSAGGQSFKALAAQTEVYTKAAATAGYTYDNRTLSWTGYGDRAGINTKYETDLSDEIHELLITQTELARQLGAATAERSTNAAAGFARYAPWLENIYMPNQYSQQSSTGNGIFSPFVRATPMPGANGYMTSVDGLSRDAYYDAFESLQNNLADRNIASGLLDMVKEAGSSMYELEALKITDSDAYAEKYLTYVERRVSAYEEVLERMDAIFSDETKSYEERIAALENYERTYAEYSQAKLDKLRLEKAQEEEEKRMMADERQAKIEGLLSWVGEVDQQGKKVVIIHGNDTTAAIEELMAEHADDPQLLTILKDMLEKTQSKARWG
jgi:hypothetical protein